MTNLELQKLLQKHPNELPIFIDLGKEDMSAASKVSMIKKHRLKDSWIEITPMRYRDEL